MARSFDAELAALEALREAPPSETEAPLRKALNSKNNFLVAKAANSHRVLLHLLPLFADKQTSVQVNAARAVEQIGTDSAALLLRLRAELASAGPELLGACYSGVLHLEGPSAIPWTAKFLALEDDPATEAAFAIAETRTEPAATLLIATHKRARNPDFRDSLLTAPARMPPSNTSSPSSPTAARPRGKPSSPPPPAPPCSSASTSRKRRPGVPHGSPPTEADLSRMERNEHLDLSVIPQDPLFAHQARSSSASSRDNSRDPCSR